MKTKTIDGVEHRLLVDGDVIQADDMFEASNSSYKRVDIIVSNAVGCTHGIDWGDRDSRYYRAIPTRPHIIEKPAKTIRYLVIEGGEYEIPDDALTAGPNDMGDWYWHFRYVTLKVSNGNWVSGSNQIWICKTEPVENWYQKLVHVGVDNG